jgi:bacterioferritin
MTETKSIHLLNKAVADELQAAHQYMYFRFHLEGDQFEPLSSLLKKMAIQEMGHVERLAKRILSLKGEVEMVPAGPVEKIAEPEAILVKAMAMEEEAARFYNQAATECGANADSDSKAIFESLAGDEEGHFDEFEKECEKIERFGLCCLAPDFGTDALSEMVDMHL